MSRRILRAGAIAAALALTLFTAACAAEGGGGGETNAGSGSSQSDGNSSGSDNSSGSNGSSNSSDSSDSSDSSSSDGYAFDVDRDVMAKAIEAAFSTKNGEVKWSGDTLTLKLDGDSSSPLAGFTECMVLKELLLDDDVAIVEYPDARFECADVLN